MPDARGPRTRESPDSTQLGAAWAEKQLRGDAFAGGAPVDCSIDHVFGSVVSDLEKKDPAAVPATDQPPAEPPKGEEKVEVKVSSKAEREAWKKEPEYERAGYQKKEYDEAEADKANLPKDADGKPIEKKGIDIATGPVFKFKTEKETIYGKTNKENKDDKSYYGGFRTKVSDVEALDLAVNTATLKVKATVVKAEGEAQIWHGQFDVGGALNDLFGLTPPPAPAPPAPMSLSPMAARVGDLTTHGSMLAPGTGSPNVLIGGLPAWRVGMDMCACTAPGFGPHGAGPTALGAVTVLINNMPAARVGDWVTEPNGGPNVIVSGCINVFIGAGAGAPPPPPGADKAPKAPRPMILFEGVWELNVGHVEGKANVYGEADGKKGKASLKAEFDAEAAGAKAKMPLAIKVAIPWTEKYLSLGGAAEASALTMGGGAGAKLENGKVEAGAKIGLGLFGGGAKLAVGIVD